MWWKFGKIEIELLSLYQITCLLHTNLKIIILVCFSAYMMWSEKTHHMVQNWLLNDIMRKFELFSFQNVLLRSPLILVSKVTDVQRLWQIKKTIRIVMLVSFILQFHLLWHVTGFHRSHHIYMQASTQQALCGILLHTFSHVHVTQA